MARDPKRLKAAIAAVQARPDVGLDTLGRRRMSALHCAASEGCVEALEELLSCGAAIESREKDERESRHLLGVMSSQPTAPLPPLSLGMPSIVPFTP